MMAYMVTSSDPMRGCSRGISGRIPKDGSDKYDGVYCLTAARSDCSTHQHHPAPPRPGISGANTMLDLIGNSDTLTFASPISAGYLSNCGG